MSSALRGLNRNVVGPSPVEKKDAPPGPASDPLSPLLRTDHISLFSEDQSAPLFKTYCVRAAYRKEPGDADAILSAARERIRVFKSGFVDGEEADDAEFKGGDS